MAHAASDDILRSGAEPAHLLSQCLSKASVVRREVERELAAQTSVRDTLAAAKGAHMSRSSAAATARTSLYSRAAVQPVPPERPSRPKQIDDTLFCAERVPHLAARHSGLSLSDLRYSLPHEDHVATAAILSGADGDSLPDLPLHRRHAQKPR